MLFKLHVTHPSSWTLLHVESKLAMSNFLAQELDIF